MLGRGRLDRDDVERRAAEAAALELAAERVQVDELRPRRVDEHGAVGHERELLLAEQALGLRRERDVERDRVAGGEQLAERSGTRPASAICSSGAPDPSPRPRTRARRRAPPAPAPCGRGRRHPAACPRIRRSSPAAVQSQPPARTSRSSTTTPRRARGRARARGRRPPRRSSRGRCRPRRRVARPRRTSRWSKPTLQVATTRSAGSRSRSAPAPRSPCRREGRRRRHPPTARDPRRRSRRFRPGARAPARCRRTWSPTTTRTAHGVTITARRPQATVHEKEIEIRWNDLDPFGHVNHAIFLTYLEEVGTSGSPPPWAATRIGLRRRPGRDRLPPRAHARRRSRHRPHPAGLAGHSSIRTLEELVVPSGETAAEAKAVLVACDAEHRPRPLTEPERAALDAA